MTQYLRFNQGDAIRLDGKTLPGVVTGIEITGEFDVERKRLEGKSFRTALAKGYKDAEVTITLEILPPDELGQLRALEAAFKINYAGAKPRPQRVVNPFIDACGVTAVLFKRLVRRQANDDEAILAELIFVEFEPLIGKADGSRPATVGGPQGLPTGQDGGGGGGGGASQPSSAARGTAAGSALATDLSNAAAKRLNLPSNGAPP